MQQRMPPVQDLCQVVQPAVVEVQDLVLGLSGRNHQLPAGAVVVVEEETQRTHLAQVH